MTSIVWEGTYIEEDGPYVGKGMKGKVPAGEAAPRASIVLGKAVEDLGEFGKATGGHPYWDWRRVGLVDVEIGQKDFSGPFFRAAKQALEIHFNVEGVDIEAARGMPEEVARTVDSTRHPLIKASGQVTEWELRQILDSDNLFRKTTFYYGRGISLTVDEAASMGLVCRNE